METPTDLQIPSAHAPTVPQIVRLTFTKQEVAEALNISLTQVWRLERDGLLRPLVGIRHKRFSVAEVNRYLSGRAA